MIFLEITVEYRVYATTTTPLHYKLQKKCIPLSNDIEIIEQDEGKCVINDNKACVTHRPVGSYTAIKEKLSKVAVLI